MDSCKNNLLNTCSCKRLNLIYYIFRLTASYPASYVWYYAVRTELVASVLNLDIRSCVFPCLVNLKRFILLILVININKIACFIRTAKIII